jgi:hypothetical protein
MAALVVAGAIETASAGAVVRLKHDEEQETRFSLDGRSLTVTVVDLPRYQQHPPTLDELSGWDVRAVCGTSFRRYTLETIARGRAHWPVGTRSMRFALNRDVSRAARWCLIERVDNHGGDVAFVSFRKAEPRRLVVRGVLDDGSGWRMMAWRGERREPCLEVRSPGRGGYGTCFERQAEQEASLDSTVISPQCHGESLLVGVVTRRARIVSVVLAGGTTVSAELHRRPSGSSVRAQYLVAALPPGVDIERVVAYDAADRRIARESGRGMFGGFCDRGRSS